MQDFELKKRQILDRVDILDVAAEHVALKRAGKRWVGLCPFHAEKTPSFTVSPELGIFKCFGCGRGGDVFSFVQLRENISFGEAMRILADRAGVDLAPTKGESQGPGRADLAKVNDWAMRFFRTNLQADDVGRAAREYLRSRKFSNSMVDRFSLGLATDGSRLLPEAAKHAGIDTSLLLAADLLRQSDDGRLYDTFRSRLMFPIRDATGRVIGFGGRTLVDDRAKYLNTRQNALFDKGRSLYGVDLARSAIGKCRRAVIVEGYTDCLAAHQAGFAETVATLGTALTESQVDLLRRYCDEIILLFDSDEAGEAAADRAIHVALPKCVTVKLARIPDGKDPSDYLSRAGADAFSDVLNRSVDALEFKWCQTRARFEGGTSDTGRREAVLDFMRVIAEAAGSRAIDAVQRGSLVTKVAHLLRIDQREVHRMMGRMQSQRREQPSVRDASPARRAPLDMEDAALTHLLEVVLNEPGLLATVDDVLDVGRIVDDRDRRIAKAVIELFDELGEFHLADVLARCHEPGDAERIEELARRGEHYHGGNFEGTFQLALERIRLASRVRGLDQRRRRLFESTSDGNVSGSMTEGLEAVHEGVKEHRHFVPRRMSQRRVADDEAAFTDGANQGATLE